MDYWVTILIVFIVLVLVSLLILLMTAVFRNLKTGKRFREQLLERLEQLPMIRMLGRHNIDIDAYLSNEYVTNIEKQLRNCGECREKLECNKVLSKEETAVDTYSFCPNDEAFENMEHSNKNNITDQDKNNI